MNAASNGRKMAAAKMDCVPSCARPGDLRRPASSNIKAGCIQAIRPTIARKVKMAMKTRISAKCFALMEE